MPAPATYIDITTAPFSSTVSPADFNAGTYSGGVVKEVWFRFVTAVQVALGGYCTATPAGFDFVALTRTYASDGSTLEHTINPGGSESNGWFFVFSAGTYYIRINNQYATNIANSFTASFDTLPILSAGDVDQGSLIINDDKSGKPATVIDSTGAVVGIMPSIPSGEVGATLPTGESIWHDSFGLYHATNKFAIFDADLTYVTSVDLTTAIGSAQPIITHDDTQFFIYHPTDRKIYSVSTTGTVAAATSALPVSTKRAFGVSRDGTMAYYSLGTTDGIIYRYDIAGNTTTTNLYAVAGWAAGSDRLAYTRNNFPGEILVLEDDTIVTWWHDQSAATTHLLHLESDGTPIDDFSYTDSVEGWIDHISYDLTDPTGAITAWFQDITFDSYGTFVSLSLDDGSLTTLVAQTVLFENGKALIEGIDTKFAPSQSCIMLSYGSVPVVVAPVEEDLSEPCCPCDCPTAPSPTGSPTTQPPVTHTGPILEPVDPLDWTPFCTGGGTVPSAADATDAESWIS